MNFINISNHPIAGWGDTQKKAAGLLNGVVGTDIPFPNVPSGATSGEIVAMATCLAQQVCAIGNPAEEEVGVWGIHIMGEQTLCFALITKLMELGYNVLASTTERVVVETPTGKTSRFDFSRFRRYVVIPIPAKEINAFSAASIWHSDKE